MKKINLIFLSIVLLVGFFGIVDLVQAGCCIGAGGNCTISSSPTGCAGSYDARDCGDSGLSSMCPGFSGSTGGPVEFENPLGVDTVSGLLTSLLENLRGIIVIIAVVFMVIGGILYMTSGGNENMVKRAKQTWTGAVVGLAIALAAPAFLNEIIDILGADVDGTGSSITIKEIAINVLNFLLSIVGVLGIISLVIGGGMYLTAYGDEKKIEAGKKIVTYAIIGIIIALGALAVTRQIAALISVTP